MHINPTRPSTKTVIASLLIAVSTVSISARAESLCASKGKNPPTALLERFTSADCEVCWAYPSPAVSAQTLVLDWIVPAASGDEAPLSAAATRDALVRLDLIDGLGQPRAELGKPWLHEVAKTSDMRLHRSAQSSKPSENPLRVTLEPGIPGYANATITLQPVPKSGIWTVWLALVERIPAGMEDTPVERFVIRNTLKRTLDMHGQLSKKEHLKFFEARAMAYPEGAKAERLGVVGWVEDGDNRVVGLTQCL